MADGDVAERDSGGMKWEDGVVYGLVLAGIYLLVGVLFFYAGKEKIFDGIGALRPASKNSSPAPFSTRSPESTPPGRSSASSSSWFSW
jgi:hypothetical protein